MRKVVYEVDEQGFIVEHYEGIFENDILITHFGDKQIITVNLPSPNNLFTPKWNGNEWIEGESEVERTEREAEQQLESFLPSPEEIENAELEIKMIALLTELEVI